MDDPTPTPWTDISAFPRIDYAMDLKITVDIRREVEVVTPAEFNQ